MFKSLKIYKGRDLDPESVTATLVEFGYKRQDAVASEGDFARRGGVVDIFPFSFELPIRISFEENTPLSINTFDPLDGSILWGHEIVIILPVNKTKNFKTLPFKEEFPLSSFIDLNIGDYVVHNQHGIGRFMGFDKIKVRDKYKDHIIIEYEGQEKLFVPVEDMNLVQKYIAFAARRPKLCKLGSKEWGRIKDITRKGIQKLAWELISVEALRSTMNGFIFSADTPWQREFEKSFPFKETPDQIKALQDVKQDMESAHPMDRLLCGDVGYGKTEVAMRAAFKAVMDNKQVVYLAPTTILVEQIYQSFSSRLKDFPITIDMLSRFRTHAQQKDLIVRLQEGRVDIVIGTHRLLSDDVQFKNLGLVIIDEEQRFGVRSKQKLKSIRLNCDILTLTATPIPRTLYMSLMGAKDLSVIDTAPQNRLPIKTSVVEYDIDLIRQAIMKEVARRGQVYFVHNRIEDIDKVKDRVSAVLPPQTRIAIGHGQMKSAYLEKVMLNFLKGNIDVLISTMIVQAGLDIPNANTIIVNNAHMFGLADLHQLRGRVGRFNRDAYAYFLVPRSNILDEEAKKRLAAIQQYSQLGSGFRIAMEDLELRGAGNLLGEQQHGYIASIGFDLYCRLLREAISNFKKAGVINETNLPQHN